MTQSPETETPETIRLALEAAEAATDAATEAQGLRSTAETALARLDRSTGRVGPLLIGCLVGSAAVLGLGALFHLRAMEDLRTATAAQIEALALFSTRVGTLDTQLAAVEGMTERLAALETQTAGLLSGVDAGLSQAVESLLEDAAARIEAAGHAQSQTTTALLDAIAASGTQTTDAVTAAASDLQLALSRMLAAGLPAETAAAQAQAQVQAQAGSDRAPAPPPAPRPARPTAPARPAAAAPAANPFSYP